MINIYKKKISYENYKSKNLLDAKKYISTRLARNKINIKLKPASKVLLIGSLEYILFIKALGANSIYATDVVKKPKFLGKKIFYKKTNLMKLNYKDSYFDFIFCNGILSHTRNYDLFLSEINRVAKKNGKVWINVYGQNLLNRFTENINNKLNKIDKANAKKVLELYGWDPSKINFILELFFYDERIVFSKNFFDEKLKKLNFKIIKFCKRGTNNDLSEMVYKNKKLKKFYGKGDLRYYLEKK